jgi:hypothetical protein
MNVHLISSSSRARAFTTKIPHIAIFVKHGYRRRSADAPRHRFRAIYGLSLSQCHAILSKNVRKSAVRVEIINLRIENINILCHIVTQGVFADLLYRAPNARESGRK